jgi:hypothetical protein
MSFSFYLRVLVRKGRGRGGARAEKKASWAWVRQVSFYICYQSW